jgi:hypothetical protein
MSYKVIANGTGYDIYEKDSDIILELKTSEENARNLCRKMNLGSGFNGWTPPFFAVKYNAIYEEA